MGAAQSGPQGPLGPSGPPGVSVKNANVDTDGNLLFTMSDKSTYGPFPIVPNSANASLLSDSLGNNSKFAGFVSSSLATNKTFALTLGKTLDSTNVATALSSDSSFQSSMSDRLSGNATLGNLVANAIGQSTTLISSFKESLASTSGSFINNIANLLTTNPEYSNKLIGKPGSIKNPLSFLGVQGGGVDALKENAYAGSLFCYTTSGNILCDTPSNGDLNVEGSICFGPKGKKWCMSVDGSGTMHMAYNNAPHDKANSGHFMFTTDGNIRLNRSRSGFDGGWVGDSIGILNDKTRNIREDGGINGISGHIFYPQTFSELWNNVVRKDKTYFIKMRGQSLSDQGSGGGSAQFNWNTGPWEEATFQEK